MWAANVPESAGRGGQVSILSHVRYQVMLSLNRVLKQGRNVLFSLLKVSQLSIMDFQHMIRLPQFTIDVSQLGFMSSQFTIILMQ